MSALDQFAENVKKPLAPQGPHMGTTPSPLRPQFANPNEDRLGSTGDTSRR
jgi:hypothetical protein